jgi:uncharacterized damage-inducible protein DinB
MPRSEALARLEAALDRAEQTLNGLDAAGLLKQYDIRGEGFSGLAIVYHVVEHFAFHSGQIIQLAKEATGRPVERFELPRPTQA